MKNRPCVAFATHQPNEAEFLEQTLTAQGCNAVRAGGGAELLDRLKTSPDAESPDLAIIDCGLSDPDGFTVCRRIKEHELTRDIPVLMLVNAVARDERLKGIEAGVDDFLPRPPDREEMQARVRTLLRLKGLSARLAGDSRQLAELVAFEEDAVRIFDPALFELASRLDSLADRLLAREGDGPGKPGAIVAGRAVSPGKWEFCRYERTAGGLRKEPLPATLEDDLDLPELPRPFSGFLNGSDFAASPLRPFIERLALYGLSARNLSCYLGESLCILALNYPGGTTHADALVLGGFAGHSALLASLALRISATEDAFDSMTQTFARVAENIDGESGNHVVRVGEYCAILAQRLGMPGDYVRRIRLQGQLHDIGKIQVSTNILSKPDRLSAPEFDEMNLHTIYGSRIIGSHSRLQLARTIALTHHERWDGSGYPCGKKGEQIPVEGRIAIIADQYDALRASKAYRESYSHEAACCILTAGDGRTDPDHFDPGILDAFKSVTSQFEEAFERLKDIPR